VTVDYLQFLATISDRQAARTVLHWSTSARFGTTTTRRSTRSASYSLKSWKILRKIRRSPSRATILVQAVQTLILAG
jgi:hypothetical protein